MNEVYFKQQVVENLNQGWRRSKLNVPTFLPLNTAAYDAEIATKSKIAPTLMARMMFIANLLVFECKVILASNDSMKSLYTQSANTEILHSNNCDSNIDAVSDTQGRIFKFLYRKN